MEREGSNKRLTELESKILTVEAPLLLLEGDHFYHQEPFESVVHSISQSADTDPVRLQRLLTRSVRILTRKDPDFDVSGFLQDSPSWYENEFVRELRGNDPSKTYRMSEQLEYEDALEEMGSQLSEFPFWAEYIASKMEPSWYGDDGEFKRRAGNKIGFIPQESYALWVTNRIRTLRNQKMLGFEDAFMNKNPDMSRKRRRWIILKASELVPQKKQNY